ncbi:MAG: zinc-binding alcohol dehydrogenase [Bacteroidia bacterium]
MQAQSLWHLSAQKSELRTSDYPTDHDPNFVEVRSAYSLISTGTERLVAQGGVPAGLYESMQVPFMEGDFGFPIKYGYSLVGEVVTAGHRWEGRCVHLLHPHQDRSWVPVDSLFLVPENVSPRRAILASNVETAITGIWDSGVSIGDKVLVLGFGSIGSLLARILQGIPGIELTVWDADPWRAALAADMGFSVRPPGKNYDCAFHTTASTPGLQLCIDSLSQGGKVVELSWFGNKETSLKLGGSFHAQRKQIISSQVSHISPERAPRWDYLRRKTAVFRLLADARYDEHLTDWVAFESLPKWFDQLRDTRPQGLMWGVEY